MFKINFEPWFTWKYREWITNYLFLDCAEIADMRGEYISNRILVNTENTNFLGCVIYKCYIKGDAKGAIILEPQKSKDVSLQLQGMIEPYSDLANANLSMNVNLSEADLRKTSFKNADLRNINFEGSNLEGADFFEANLQGANLQNTNLNSAQLRGASIEGANLEGAKMYHTFCWGLKYDKDTVLPKSIKKWQLDQMRFVKTS